LYEPGHQLADEDGFRTDVLDLVRELGITVVRYPGGNFVSGYRWEDGVGPVSERPTRLDPAWRSVESNQFGLGEFIRWCRKAQIEPMLALNLGTRGTQQAIEEWEYCNHLGGTYWSDLRRQHGAAEPYDIRMWCLGNEMDGPWQLGHKSADEYGRLAAATARALRQFDAGLELVACGSSHRQMPTFGSWEATVLEHTYDDVDFISAHAYYQNQGDLASFLASSVNMDTFITDVVATADHVRARLNKSKRINVSFDEWNVWYLTSVPRGDSPWRTTPRISEEAYTLSDAVVVGSLLITLLRHSDRVTCACLAQLVNTIAPIRTEPAGAAWRQTIFYPFALTARHARGEVLRVEPTAPTYSTSLYGDAPVLDATATRDPDSGDITIFAVNRSQHEPVQLNVNTAALDPVVVQEAVALTGPDPSAANTEHDPNRVIPTPLHAEAQQGTLGVQLPPVSWACIRLGTNTGRG
jgi:alpha-N-arabinofuranosidase